MISTEVSSFATHNTHNSKVGYRRVCVVKVDMRTLQVSKQDYSCLVSLDGTIEMTLDFEHKPRRTHFCALGCFDSVPRLSLA
jgi:hypothetical protein